MQPPLSELQFRQCIVLLIALLVLASCASPEAQQVSPSSQTEGDTASEERPNIVLIISDDQRWDDFSFMGHPVIETPHLDRLAAESALFENGYVPSSLCRPSLATIITGQYPHQHGITSNDPPEGVHRARMLRFIARARSLPRILRQFDYASLQTGKWWEGHYATGGFTDGMTINGSEGRHGDHGLTIGRETMKPVYDFIEARQEQPFLLWYAPFLPHTPHNPPERLLQKYQEEGHPEELAKYYAMCEWFDETVGELLSYLDGKGLRKNTIVLFAVDNGWVQNVDREQGEFLFAPRSKRSPYDGGVRTPIMIRWPGHVEPGRREALASTVDFVPTVLKAVGLPLPVELPGKDLVELSRQDAEHEAVYGEIFMHDAVDLSQPAASLKYRWVREGDWKLIVPVGSEPAELYNVAEDPSEEVNRIEENPEVAEHLHEQLNRWWQPEGDTTGARPPSGSLSK